MLKQSHPLAPPASQFWWKPSLHLSHLLTVVFWRKLGFYSHWVGPPFPICSHLCLPFLSVLVSFLYFRSADWYYGCITITPYLKCLEPGVFHILEFCIFWIISMHNAALHLGVFVTFVTAVTRYTTGSNLARFIFFSYSPWGGKIHGDTNAWWWECKGATSHCHSGRREGNTGTHNAPFSLSVCSIWEHRPWDGATHTRGGSSLDRHAEKCLS